MKNTSLSTNCSTGFWVQSDIKAPELSKPRVMNVFLLCQSSSAEIRNSGDDCDQF